MSEKLKRLFSTENLIVAAVIFVAIFFAKFPTVYNWLNTPKGYWYPKNTSWYDAWDTNFQVSYMRYAQRKGVALQNTYTTVPHKPVVIYQYYTYLGLLNRFLRLDPFILYHLTTVIFSVVLIIALYFLAKVFFDDSLFRLGSFMMMVLGGGLGWIPGMTSADLNLAGFTMVNAFEKSQEAFSTACIIFSFLFIFRYLQTPKRGALVWAVVFACGNIIFHPPFAALYLAAGLPMAFIYFLSKKSKELFIYPLGTAVFFIIYFLLILSTWFGNPGFASVVGQSLYTVDSFSLALGFGLLSFFIFWEIMEGDRRDIKVTALKVVFLTQLFLLLSPLGFHLYFAKGIFIWGVILGFMGIACTLEKKNIQMVVITALVSVSILTRIVVFNSLMNASVKNSFFFLVKGEGDALAFMSGLPADSAVLSLYRMGNYIPAHTDSRVYYGHKFQTPDNSETLRKAQIFYTLANEEQQRKFLKDNHINYIYYGLEEAQLRKDDNLNPRNPFPYFPVLYSNDSAIIYSASASAGKTK